MHEGNAVEQARAALQRGDHEAAIAALDQAWLAGVEQGDPVDAVALDLEYGQVLLAAGDANAALVRVEEAWRAAQDQHRLDAAAKAARIAAEACIARGRVDLARRCADASVAAARALGDRTEEARAQLVVAEALGRMGAPAAGATRALAAHDALSDNGEHVLAACAARVAARMLVHESLSMPGVDHLVVARELLSDACSVFDRRGYDVHGATAHRELAEVLVEIGARTHDRKCMEAALPHFAYAIMGYTDADLAASAQTTARREAWTLQLLDRSADAAAFLNDACN